MVNFGATIQAAKDKAAAAQAQVNQYNDLSTGFAAERARTPNTIETGVNPYNTVGAGGGGAPGAMAPPNPHPAAPRNNIFGPALQMAANAGWTPGSPPPGPGGPAGPAPAAGPAPINWIDVLRQRQLSNLDDLTNAAAGKTPSAAEILGQQMAARGAAQQYGLAAALQGGHSAGNVLRRAQMGSADVAARAREDAMAQRAQEMAVARNQLTAALGQGRSAEDQLRIAQGQLNQNDRNALLQAQLEALGLGMKQKQLTTDAAMRDQAANDAFNAQLLNAGLSLGGLALGGPVGGAIGSKVAGSLGSPGPQQYNPPGRSSYGDELMPPSF